MFLFLDTGHENVILPNLEPRRNGSNLDDHKRLQGDLGAADPNMGLENPDHTLIVSDEGVNTGLKPSDVIDHHSFISLQPNETVEIGRTDGVSKQSSTNVYSFSLIFFVILFSNFFN